MSNQVTIRVLLFGAARDAVNASSLELTLDAPATVSSAFQKLVEKFAQLERFGRSLLFAVNEEYDSMELTEMQRLGAEAHKRFEIAHIGIVHRAGRLDIGETSVVIAVSAPHRQAAFQACEWAIKELKRTVPIWKKEVYEDGED